MIQKQIIINEKHKYNKDFNQCHIFIKVKTHERKYNNIKDHIYVFFFHKYCYFKILIKNVILRFMYNRLILGILSHIKFNHNIVLQ